jgi:hypothetical protein
MANGRVGAPVGNRNGAKNKPWEAALTRHALQNPERLARLAEKLFEMALAGDVAAIKELGDRLDGKALQRAEITGEDGASIFPDVIRVELVAADAGKPRVSA